MQRKRENTFSAPLSIYFLVKVYDVMLNISLFRNKKFMLDEMTQRNTSKFDIFYTYENPMLLFWVSFHASLLFPLMNALLVFVDIDQEGHSLGKK